MRANRWSALALLAGIACAAKPGARPSAMSSQVDDTSLILREVVNHVHLQHPGERVAVHRQIYCGYPVLCSSSVQGTWPDRVLESAARAAGETVTAGGLRVALDRSADRVIAIGPIHFT